MDVEQIQKVNNLAIDLMKQGLATDREEAIKQAEKIFQGKDSEEYNSLKETLEAVEEHKKPEQKPTTELSQDEIKQILQQNTEFIVRKFKEFHEKIESLENDISTLRTSMTYNKLPTAESVKPKSDEILVQEASAPPAPPTEPVEGNPRTGHFKENEVSIEKFFYMGSK